MGSFCEYGFFGECHEMALRGRDEGTEGRRHEGTEGIVDCRMSIVELSETGANRAWETQKRKKRTPRAGRRVASVWLFGR